MKKDNLGLLASGNGTTVGAILKARIKKRLKRVRPALIIASSYDAGVIQLARDLDFPPRRIHVVPRHRDMSDVVYGRLLLGLFKAYNITLVGQYGWLPKTPRNVIQFFDWGKRIINQHPAPVPWFGGKKFYGIVPHATVLYFVRALQRHNLRDCRHTYVVTQRAALRYNMGTVLHYKTVEIFPNDTPHTLKERALPVEWDVQIETLERFASGYTGPCPVAQFVYPGERKLLTWARKVALNNYAQ